MKTAVIYARYSSDNQTEQSIEGQLRVCEEYAKQNDILIVDTYIDRAMTGTNDNRPDFQRMLKDSNKKKWDYVLVYKFDRFSRNKYETTIHKHTLANNGVKVISAMENIPDTPEGIILESLLEGMNQYYSAELAQKVKRGMRETRLKGLFQGGKLTYGYKVENRKLVIDETQAEVVKYVYRQYLNGEVIRNIIKVLTSKGILYKGKPFVINALYNMLNNEKYIGIYRKDNDIYENMFPRIIDNETFEKAQKKLHQNHFGKKSIKTVYLLRHKLTCGYCGKPISAECGTTRNGKRINYYKCLGIKRYQNGCQKETLRQDILEQFLLDTIINEISKPKTIDILVNNLIAIQNNQNKTNSTLNILEKNKKQLETTLQNIMNAIEMGIINKTTNARMKELENQIDDIDRQIIIEKSKMNVKISESEIKEYYKEALKLEPLALINYLIKEIKLYNDKVEIIYNTPLKTSPNNQGLLFLSIKKYMKKVIQNAPIRMIEMQVEFYI